MTSNIIYGGIDQNYPVAGQDNDSQGFRDNFSYIKDALTVAATEITDLQTKAVLKGDLEGGDAVDNNLGGGSIYNGFYRNFFGDTHTDSVSTQTDIEVNIADAQVFTINADVDFTFRNWPGTLANKKYAPIRIHLRSGNGAAHYATFYSENAGVFYCESNVTVDTQSPAHPKIQVSANGKDKVIEVWSVSDGSKLYVRYLGEF